MYTHVILNQIIVWSVTSDLIFLKQKAIIVAQVMLKSWGSLAWKMPNEAELWKNFVENQNAKNGWIGFEKVALTGVKFTGWGQLLVHRTYENVQKI